MTKSIPPIFIMTPKEILLLIGIFVQIVNSLSQYTLTDLQILFPERFEYIYLLKATVSTGIDTDTSTFWTLDGRLSVLLLSDVRARLQLKDLKASAFSGKHGHSSELHEDAVRYLSQPWEVSDFHSGWLAEIYFGTEPVWSKNVKRALSVNMQYRKNLSSFERESVCLHMVCEEAVYSVDNRHGRYVSIKKPYPGSEYYWSSVPFPTKYVEFNTPNSMSLENRVYEVDDIKGLKSLELKETYKYKLKDNLFSVISELSLYIEAYNPVGDTTKLDLNKASMVYEPTDGTNPSNGIRDLSQDLLRNKTYELLLKIATKGIDADNIVRNANLIHNLDLTNLLSTIAQMDYDHLLLLFKDLILGTSYEVETARNIFLEMIAYAQSHDCARFVKYLVVEEKEKIEDSVILNMIRRLPFNIAKYSKSLLEELETFTKLGLDFSPEIRRAGILSFATLIRKTRDAKMIQQDYLDYIVVKYFRMYSDCPKYIDRLIWLQGLCNIGEAAQSYTNTIFLDNTKNMYERLWAALGQGPDETVDHPYDENYPKTLSQLEAIRTMRITLPVLTNETESIHLRIAAVHMLLGSKIGRSDFLFLHNYIKNSTDDQLKNFWYSTMIGLDSNKSFGRYKRTAKYVPYVIDEIKELDVFYWATNNRFIVEGDHQAALQLITIGDETMMPVFAGVTLTTEGFGPYEAGVYVIAEGVPAGLLRKLKDFNFKEMKAENLTTVLQELGAWSRNVPAEAHIDVVVKVQNMAVYVEHVNQTQFFEWNVINTFNSVWNFLRFGSHINQQTLFVPSQMEIHVPSALGIPIRIQSSSMSFSSIRGNLSATVGPNQVIKNDLHIRYQGISSTTLSTDGLLVQSKHFVRTQSSVVAHLPIKFNLSLEDTVEWKIVVSKKGGIAMHSRTQVGVEIADRVYARTVPGEKKKINTSDHFPDCQYESTGLDALDRLLESNGDFAVLKTIKQLLILFKSMTLYVFSPVKSCGLLFPPQNIARNGEEVIEIKTRLRFDTENSYLPNFKWLNLTCGAKYYSYEKPDEVYMNLDTRASLDNVGDHSSTVITLVGDHPKARKHWKFNFQRELHTFQRLGSDISTAPIINKDVISISYNITDGIDSSFKMKYNVKPVNDSDVVQKSLIVTTDGRHIPFIDNILEFSIGKDSESLKKSLPRLDKHYNVYAALEEKNGLVTVRVNNETERQFISPDFGWYLDRWTEVQIKRRLGLYRECRLQESIVHTIHGNVEMLAPMACPHRVIVADCTERPRFAILRLSDKRLRVYSGGYFVELKEEPGLGYQVHSDENAGDVFQIITANSIIKITSSETYIDVYYKHPEIVILLPSPYMTGICGECVGDIVPRNC